MNTRSLAVLLAVAVLAGFPSSLWAQNAAPAGKTLYVSKLGDDSDGSSWEKAFRTVQKALLAVPDDTGGHRIIIRPDTYMEANLYPAHKGAKGAWNTLVGDFDGSLGSGRKGWVILDAGDPEKGFKSYDWWGNIRSYSKGWSKEHQDETFSAIGWDRWELKRLYATGGDGGLFFDCTDRVEPFSILVEDCVSIGRAFGGGVASCLARPEEPITYRRCHLHALDWWGDTAAAYVRVENQAMPDQPDVFFEDCVMVGPQCALKGGNFGFKTFTRAKCTGSKLIALNFSQPAGTPTDGVVQSVQAGKHFAADFEDCLLMGYTLFGVKVETETLPDFKHTTKGNCMAYVQFQQPVPEGFQRLGHWPAEHYADLIPPAPDTTPVSAPLEKKLVQRDLCEVSPVVWKGRNCLMKCIRPASGGAAADYRLELTDGETGEVLAAFGEGHSLGCAFVHEETFHAFASRFEKDGWTDIHHFWSKDLKTWEDAPAIRRQKGEGLFNSSVCQGPDGFVMAYESNDRAYPAFTAKFARSDDLKTWTPVPGALLGTDRYAACPCIRFANGFYYVLYLEHRTPRWFFETYIARSADLKAWELSAENPVLSPQGLGEGINASDPDLGLAGSYARLFYAVGDQRTWMNIKSATYPRSPEGFLESWFSSPGIPCK